MFKYRDEQTAKKILERIGEMDMDVRFMHICGTHQDTIVRFGLEDARSASPRAGRSPTR